MGLRLVNGAARCLAGCNAPPHAFLRFYSLPPSLDWLASQQMLGNTIKVQDLIRRFRANGHLAAGLDPLRRTVHGPWLAEGCTDRLEFCHTLASFLDQYNNTDCLRRRTQVVAQYLDLAGDVDENSRFTVYPNLPNDGVGQHYTLTELVDRYQSLYCSTLALEAAHLTDEHEAAWITTRFEQRALPPPAERVNILRQLVQAEVFEQFLSEKFPASKRFGLEGCESLLPGLYIAMKRSAHHGVKQVEMGMAHRGRLNVLVNLLGKPLGALCCEMEGRQSDFHVGDVKYHQGQSGILVFQDEEGRSRKLRMSIAPNPSHLEANNAVVLGMVRAEQEELHDDERKRVMGLLVHGDAAFAGQGTVAECLQLAKTPGFTTGGTLHVILNNQVGFTTSPYEGRSGPHPSEVAKMIGAPILHANADDPDAVYQACCLASDWRAWFGTDVVVDIVGYRRNGHNEQDDPFVTLPQTYQLIAQHPSVVQLYTKRLVDDGKVCQQQVDEWRTAVRESYLKEYQLACSGEYVETAKAFLQSSWQGEALKGITEALWETGQWGEAHRVMQEPTGLPLSTLQRVGHAICTPPADFRLHPEVETLLARRREMVKDQESRVDWGMAEALAFGTLMLRRTANRPTSAPLPDTPSPASPPLGAGLNRGHYHVRLTGQDVERGTFNQRHAVLVDQVTGSRRVALNFITSAEQQDHLSVWNSPLSEAAVLGFEYGYSLGAKDNTLVIWEAQFGDFSNNAQVIIDQFISSGEEKWGQQSGLVVLLPHGYDGQGPDHSSARIERWLSLCRDDADFLPGHSPAHRRLIRDTFHALSSDGLISQQQALDILRSLSNSSTRGNGDTGQYSDGELVELLWAEMGLPEGASITRAAWEHFMVQYLRRFAEREANLFLVNCTSPAQYFHALRRQMNLPYKKPLIMFTPKYLLHHRPCTSALKDFSVGSFFNRVIDDGKASDNTRHLGVDRTGRPFLLPPEAIRRVIICSGQVYYTLSRARRQLRIRDVVLVRLEQLSPFPHDLVVKVVGQYPAAELVWCQEEPKNMGAWLYVKPRMEAALSSNTQDEKRGLQDSTMEAPVQRRTLRYIGRPAQAAPATASLSIHQKEMQYIVNTALQ